MSRSFKKYRGREVVVAWSGGLDSTGLMIAMAEAGAIVTAISIASKILPNLKHERFARHRIKEKLRDVKFLHDIKYKEVEFDDVEGGELWPNVYRYGQKQFWLSMLSLVVPARTEVVAIGAVADDNISPIPNLKRQWKAAAWNVKDKWKYPALEFPLSNLSKVEVCDIIDDFCEKREVDFLIDEIIWCESTMQLGSRIYACGKCPSCRAARLGGIQTLHPMANSQNEAPALNYLMNFAKMAHDHKLFYIYDSDMVRSFYMEIDVNYGDGTAAWYNGTKFTIDRDTVAIVYLGMGKDFKQNDLDAFEERESLPEDHHMVNPSEYESRKLQYLINRGYNLEVGEYLDLAHE